MSTAAADAATDLPALVEPAWLSDRRVTARHAPSLPQQTAAKLVKCTRS